VTRRTQYQHARDSLGVIDMNSPALRTPTRALSRRTLPCRLRLTAPYGTLLLPGVPPAYCHLPARRDNTINAFAWRRLHVHKPFLTTLMCIKAACLLPATSQLCPVKAYLCLISPPNSSVGGGSHAHPLPAYPSQHYLPFTHPCGSLCLSCICMPCLHSTAILCGSCYHIAYLPSLMVTG